MDGAGTLAQLGACVASAGDVNGDGYGDVIVAAPSQSRGILNQGVVFVFLGSAAGLSTDPDWSAAGGREREFFGTSVATAGDVNGDGYSDVVVGSYYFIQGESTSGRAYLFLGSATGLATSPAWIGEDKALGSGYGESVATAGDVNGDGYSDLIVGSSTTSNGQIGEGRAYLYLGSASGLAQTPAWTAESGRARAQFGSWVATAGDVNGDGYSDVLVGAPWLSLGKPFEGRAYLYMGSAAGLAPSPAWRVEGDQALALLGYRVASAGDVDGDGFSDVIIGAGGYTNGQDGEGRAYLYRGSASGLDTTPAWTAEGNSRNATFGFPVASAGDVNGDGYSDVIVGAYNYFNGQLAEGAAFAFLGSATGLETNASWMIESNQRDASFGYSLASAGDVNGDGYSDAIVGAYAFGVGRTGAAFVFLGNEGRPGVVRAIQQRRKNDSRPIALLGRIGPDGLFRIQVELVSDLGAPPGTRAFLEWEVKPLGEPFDGATLSRSREQPLPGPGGVVTFNELVDAGFSRPTENASFHWRARIATGDPLVPPTLWFSQEGNNVTEAKLRKPKMSMK